MHSAFVLSVFYHIMNKLGGYGAISRLCSGYNFFQKTLFLNHIQSYRYCANRCFISVRENSSGLKLSPESVESFIHPSVHPMWQVHDCGGCRSPPPHHSRSQHTNVFGQPNTHLTLQINMYSQAEGRFPFFLATLSYSSS